MKEIRKLRADEIECRIGQIKKDGSGLSLLLYKDARCDMNILDETFGMCGWQRRHGRDNANCVVSIWDEERKQWIEKEDTGTESNTEAEKGLASDSFKRACVNVGIGRELYTAPFIWVTECSIKDGKCYDKFSVKEISYDDAGNIADLVIVNAKTGFEVFSTKRAAKAKPTQKNNGTWGEIAKPIQTPEVYCEECGKLITAVETKSGKKYDVETLIKQSGQFYGKCLCYACSVKEARKPRGTADKKGE